MKVPEAAEFDDGGALTFRSCTFFNCSAIELPLPLPNDREDGGGGGGGAGGAFEETAAVRKKKLGIDKVGLRYESYKV